jgi:hypothetical protein
MKKIKIPFDEIPMNEVSVFPKAVHLRGKELEERVEKYLTAERLQYRRNKNNGIDFVINGGFHMDCVAQGVSGTIGDKLPHKCWKYIKRYGLKNIYILHPYSPIHRQVGEHLEFLEKQLGAEIHILNWSDFTYLMQGGKFEKRKPYVYSRDSRGVSHLAPTNYKMEQFFSFSK